jgi:hypothetical protein
LPYQLPQRRRIHRPDRQGVVQTTPPPSVHHCQAQVHQRRHQPGDRGGIQQFEERIAPDPKRGIHGGPEATQAIERNGIEHAQSYGLTRVLDPKNPGHHRPGLNRKLNPAFQDDHGAAEPRKPSGDQ